MTTFEGFSPNCNGDKEATHIMVLPEVHLFHREPEGMCQDFVLDKEAGGPWPQEREHLNMLAILREFRDAKAGKGDSRYWQVVVDEEGVVAAPKENA